MTNPMILKLMSSLLNGKASGNIENSKSGKGNRRFFSDMLKAFQASKKGAFIRDDKTAKINTTSNSKGYTYYIESFRKALLAQGKPLNKTFLNENDLPLIKAFLLQCGFSHEKSQQFIKDLKTDDSNGKINLSQIFLKITELGSQKRKEHQNKTVPPATVPYMESILRDFNLTPKELDGVFSKARIEGGRIDLHKLIKTLKAIKGQKNLGNKTVVDKKLSRDISDKMEMIGMSMPHKGKAERISLKDFIASLEKITEKSDNVNKVSPDIKNTVGKILERVELVEQKAVSASPVKVASNYHFTESLLKGDMTNNSRQAFNEKKISSKNKSASSFLKQKDVKVQNNVMANTATSDRSGKKDLLSNLNKQKALINSVNQDGYRADKEALGINSSRNTEALSFTNTFKTVEHGEKPFRGYLPASIVDQVGKQISRSILRGDQVVTLQLKPPDLGTVKIKMDIKDHTLRLGVIAEHQSVKELLLNNIHELKEALVQHGVKLDKVDVQINYNFGHSLNASKERTDNGQGSRNDINGEEFYSNNHIEETDERSIKMMSGSNLVDLVA